MNIGIDVRPMESHSRNRGIGYYTSNLISLLIENDQKNNYHLYTRLNTKLSFRNKKNNCFYHKVPIVTRPIRAVRKFDPLVSLFWKYSLYKTKPDILHITSLFEVYFLQVPKNIKTVITIYDLIPILFKNKFFDNKKAQDWYMKRLNQAKRASKIITISESSKKDIMKILKIADEKIKVIYGGVEKRFIPINKNVALNFLEKQYKIKAPFILTIGSATLNKNVDGVFKAFELFKKKRESSYNLVVVCKLEPQEEKLWRAKLKTLGIEKFVTLTNFVADNDLPYFYNAADLLLQPSFYEGLGLPILEGMACGLPVVTSNTSSLPEVGGDAVYYVDPYSKQDICDGIEKVLKNVDLQNQMIKKGLKRVRKFTWENATKQLMRVYEEVLEEV